MLGVLKKAIKRDLSFIARRPTALFQCLWNSCWWYDRPDAAEYYDPPAGGWDAEGPPWERGDAKLHAWMQVWRENRERSGGPVWVRSSRPPSVPLGGALQAICVGHSGSVNAIAFSPDGRVFASAARGNSVVRVWDRETGRELTGLRGSEYMVLCELVTRWSCASHRISGPNRAVVGSRQRPRAGLPGRAWIQGR